LLVVGLARPVLLDRRPDWPDGHTERDSCHPRAAVRRVQSSTGMRGAPTGARVA
jgi:hypothetical protein